MPLRLEIHNTLLLIASLLYEIGHSLHYCANTPENFASYESFSMRHKYLPIRVCVDGH